MIIFLRFSAPSKDNSTEIQTAKDELTESPTKSETNFSVSIETVEKPSTQDITKSSSEPTDLQPSTEQSSDVSTQPLAEPAEPPPRDFLAERLAEFDTKLKPGYVWKPKELKELNLHFQPQVVLLKLKHDKFYHDELKPNRPSKYM